MDIETQKEQTNKENFNDIVEKTIKLFLPGMKLSLKLLQMLIKKAARQIHYI